MYTSLMGIHSELNPIGKGFLLLSLIHGGLELKIIISG